MSSEMIERVARAIFNTAVGDDKWNDPWYADEQKGCYGSARAAIEAMREPTDEMCRADAGTSTTQREIWNAALYRAMISAALSSPAEDM